MSGDTKGAEQVFREDLVKNPRNPRSLFGLERTLRDQGRESDAWFVEKQFPRVMERRGVESGGSGIEGSLCGGGSMPRQNVSAACDRQAAAEEQTRKEVLIKPEPLLVFRENLRLAKTS